MQFFNTNRHRVIFKKSIHLVDGVIDNPVVSQVGLIIIIFYLVLKSFFNQYIYIYI